LAAKVKPMETVEVDAELGAGRGPEGGFLTAPPSSPPPPQASPNETMWQSAIS
jgi:hypothetical protein